MKKIVSLISLLVTLGFSQGKVMVNASDLPPEVLQKIEDEKKLETAGKYVGLGKEIGEAVKGSLSSFTDETDKFSKTGVGKFTMFIVAWKVVGGSIFRILFGFPLFFIGTVIFIWSFWKNCIPKVVLDSEDNEGLKQYTTINIDHRSEMLWGHFLAYGVFCIFCSLITLVNF